MLQFVHLRAYLGIHRFIAMSDADGDNATEEIQVLVSVSIPDILIFCAIEDQRLFEVMEYGRKNVFLLRQQNLVFCHRDWPNLVSRWSSLA